MLAAFSNWSIGWPPCIPQLGHLYPLYFNCSFLLSSSANLACAADCTDLLIRVNTEPINKTIIATLKLKNSPTIPPNTITNPISPISTSNQLNVLEPDSLCISIIMNSIARIAPLIFTYSTASLLVTQQISPITKNKTAAIISNILAKNSIFKNISAIFEKTEDVTAKNLLGFLSTIFFSFN